MFENTLAPATKKLLQKLTDQNWRGDFYLAGDTALAMQYGHRQSIDLDWFTSSHINLPQLLKNVSAVGSYEVLNQTKDTLEGVLENVKVSFMTYPYPLIKKPILWQGVALAAPLDIAIMKLGAVAGRNTKKDFIDLYIFLEKEQTTLAYLLAAADKKFTGANFDRYHLYKSLAYFDDADQEPMPKMLIALDWKKIKNFFLQEVKKLTN